MMKAWLIVSPEYGEVIPVTDEGQGPVEYGADVVHVEAETRRDAVILGVQLFKRRGARYLHHCDGGPYAGVHAIAQDCPAHGMPQWNRDHYECPQCDALVGYDNGDQVN